MANEQDQAIQSGARQVEEREHLAAGMEQPRDVSIDEREPESGKDEPVKTELGEMTLSMFQQGQSVRVRVGNAHNSVEMYEHAFERVDEANSALLDAGILRAEQVPDVAELAGTGVVLTGVTAEQLEQAGLKRHGSSSL